MDDTGRRGKNPINKLVKGKPYAVLLSILIHVGMVALATLLVVVVVPKPPDVPGPKIQPRHKRIKPAPPKPPSPKMQDPSPSKAAPITSTANPEFSEITAFDRPPGDGGPGRIGGGPGISITNIVIDLGPGKGPWKKEPIGSDLVGTYYDFKRNSEGTYTGAGQDTFRDAIRKFLNNGWNTAEFSEFYHSPEKRYLTHVMVPTMSSSVAPTAFNENPASGYFWLVHCRGEIVVPKDITFRFWGVGDEILAVRLNRKVVFADVWHTDRDKYGNFWRGSDPQSKQYYLGYNTTMEVGDWVTLKKGEPADIEIIMGDNGGLAALMLLVEVQGVEYPTNKQGGPILPVFKTAELTRDELDWIYKDLYEGDACLTNGPVFNDFAQR